MQYDEHEAPSDEGQGMEISIIQTAPELVKAQDEALIDRQVATANAYPRSLSTFQNELRTLVCSDQEFAEECTYTLRRGGKRITGPSVRFAEILLSTYRHLFVDTRVVEEALRHITVEATCRDAETNIAARIQVRKRITTKAGKRFNDDMVTVAVNAAISMAIRNAIFRVVPKPLWIEAWRESIRVAHGDEKGFQERRDAAIQWLCDHGSTLERILHYCRKKDIESLEIDDIMDLRQIARQVHDQNADIDTLLPEPELAHDPTAAKRTAEGASAALRRGASKEPERDPNTGEIIPDHVGRHDEPEGQGS